MYSYFNCVLISLFSTQIFNRIELTLWFILLLCQYPNYIALNDMIGDIVADYHRFTGHLGALLLEPPLELHMRLQFDFSATGSNTMRYPFFKYFEQVPTPHTEP